MANYASLKAAIQQVIKTNGNEEITGALLQQSLLAMINSLGSEYQFCGIATPSTDPGTPDHNVAYIAGAGTYPNFNNTTVQINTLACFKYNGSWTVETATVGQDYDQQIKEIETDGFVADVIQYSSFSSQTPNVTLPNYIRLTQPGDYIEIKATPNNNGMMIRGVAPYNNPRVSYSGQHTIQIRFSITEQFVYQNVRTVDWSKIQIIRIVLSSVINGTYSYVIYLNDIEIGTKDINEPTDWNQIGYQSTMTLYYIKILANGSYRKYVRFASMAGAVGIVDTYAPMNIESLADVNIALEEMNDRIDKVGNSPLLFNFIKESTLWDSDSNFWIYVHLFGEYYMGIAIVYYNPANPTGPSGYWRMERCNLMRNNNGVWEDVIVQALVAGENEFVLSWTDGAAYNYASGYSGGYHTGETVNAPGAWVEFIVDGRILEIPENDLPIKACASFIYREYTPIYQKVAGTIAAWHLKETEITRNGYKCRNEVIFTQNLGYYAMAGICCVSRSLGVKAMPENANEITDMGDGTTVIANQFASNGHRIHYEGNGIITEVTSKVLFGPDDSQCSRYVWNGPSYTKFYRQTPNVPGSENNRLVCEQEVIFIKQ